MTVNVYASCTIGYHRSHTHHAKMYVKQDSLLRSIAEKLSERSLPCICFGLLVAKLYSVSWPSKINGNELNSISHAKIILRVYTNIDRHVFVYRWKELDSQAPFYKYLCNLALPNKGTIGKYDKRITDTYADMIFLYLLKLPPNWSPSVHLKLLCFEPIAVITSLFHHSFSMIINT